LGEAERLCDRLAIIDREQSTLEPEEMAPSKLDDIEAVRTYLKQLIQQGRAEQALEMLLDLLVRLKDAHTATTVRLYDALRKLYGRKSERLNPNQLELFVSELLKGPEGDETQADNAPKKVRSQKVVASSCKLLRGAQRAHARAHARAQFLQPG